MRALLSLDYNEMVELLVTVSHAKYLITKRITPIDDVEAIGIEHSERTLWRMESLIESALNLARIENKKENA